MHKLLQLAGKLLSHNKLSTLVYHQVLAKYDPMRPSEPTAEIFDWHMRVLRNYFTPLSLDNALQHIQQNTLPANAVCVTFDDGYLNTLTVAQPILAKYGIPATVYVATGFSLGTNMWNDRLIYLFADKQRKQLKLDDELLPLVDDTKRREKAQQWLKKLKYLPVAERLAKIDSFYQQNNAAEQTPLMMTPTEIKQLAGYGVTIGAHTVNHPILKVLPEAQQLEEIRQSKQQLESWLSTEVLHFAYPNGFEGKDFDDATTTLVKQTGFKSAVSFNSGVSTARTSLYKLKRFTPWDTTALKFHARLLNNMRQAHH